MISLDTLKKRSGKRMGSLNAEVKEKVHHLIETAYNSGIYVQISSGHRTLTEQAILYGQGRPGYYWRGKKYGSAGSIVTYAKPGQSTHHDGRAVDFFLVSSDGKTALWTVNDQWRRVADIAKSLGFHWGGDWKSFKDYCHLELPSGHKRKEEEGVKDLQKMLMDLGYSPGPVDGSYGPLTKAAVRRFQRKESLAVDGIAGPITMTRLKERTYPGSPVFFGSKGNNVKSIQAVVKTKTDGIFGEKTEAAVSTFQHDHNLEIDGVVGPETWKAMFGI